MAYKDLTPVINTANPYLTEAAMHLDQSNQLEGYGYLVDGVGAFTYLGTLAETAADYEGFGGGLDLRASNLAGDLTTAEKDAIRLKIGTAISPAPYLEEVIPDSYLPSTTGNFKLKGSFFTENMTVTTTGGTVNQIIFNNDNEVDLNITTGAAEGSFSITLNNGISKTFNNVLLIILGNVISPISSEWINKSNIDVSKGDEINLTLWGTAATAEWTRLFDYTRDWSFRFTLKGSILGEPNNNTHIKVLELFRDDASSFLWAGFLRVFETTKYSYTYKFNNISTTALQPSTDNLSEVEDHYFELRYVGGVFTVYLDTVLKFTSDVVLNSNLRLIVSTAQMDIKKIKYIEI